MKGRRFMVILMMLGLLVWQIGAVKVMAVDISCIPVQGGPGVNTALGCVPVEMGAFMSWLLPYLFGISGGISFLLMVYGFIMMSTSGGDPKAVQGAQETITSAITCLLVSIFALFLLRLIAVKILQIPGLN
jgi:hypothetical protein